MITDRAREEVEDFERLKEITQILLDEGFGFILKELGLGNKVPFHHRIKPRGSPERLRETFEELGPTFIKFGQILAQRPDILPREYTEELEKLEDDVSSFNAEKAREIIDEDTGMENFTEFEEEPVAAASIAQVHRAKLKNGEEVAVKVRRPGIVNQISKDLDILKFLAKEGEKHSEKMKKLRTRKMVKQFASWTQDELDFQKERRNIERTRQNFQDEDRVKIPGAYPELSSERVLIMEFMEGVKCTEKEEMKQLEIDQKQVAKTAIELGIKQVVRDGFFHADPHPSNFLLNQEGEIILLDFGMMGEISKKKRRKIGLLFLHAVDQNVDAAMDIIKDIAYVEDDADLEELKEIVEHKIMEAKNATLAEYSISRELLDITIEAGKKGVHMPASFALIGKSLVTMEGIGLTIYPDFKMTEEYEDTAEEILRHQNNPKKLARNIFIDLLQNREAVERPFSTLRNAATRQNHSPDIQIENRQNLFTPALILSSAVLFHASLKPQPAFILGVGELLLAAYIYTRNRKTVE
ncbi:MAG: ABC1 kinase family protein [Candidatus Nanohaloarchaea archaeon]